MEETDKFALVIKPPGALEKAEPGAKRILSSMVADTLALVKKDSPQKPAFTVLLGSNYNFATLELFLASKLGETHNLKFFYFSRSSELVKLAEENPFDLVFARMGIFRGDIASDSGSWRRAADILGHLKARYGKPIVATLGLDLSAELEPKGVIFLEAPFTFEDFWTRLQPELATPVTVRSLRDQQAQGLPALPPYTSTDLESWCRKGEAHFYGRGVSKDYLEAGKWFRMAAERGYARAQWWLGTFYERGRGVPQDYAKATKWFRKASEQGYAHGQNALGACYQTGRGIPQDYVKAVIWYRKAAEQGNDCAQYNLGCCYRDGHGLPIDVAEAVKWFRKAAEQGNHDAQSDLGHCYFYAKGTPQNHFEAVKWFRKAAVQGHPRGQMNLGRCYKEGRGVARDYCEAYKCFKLAANNTANESYKWFTLAVNSAEDGREYATELLNSLSSTMSPDELEEGERLYRALKAAH